MPVDINATVNPIINACVSNLFISDPSFLIVFQKAYYHRPLLRSCLLPITEDSKDQI
jgi:hypothetical protein